MWIYKRSGGKYTMVDCVDSTDSFEIEERIIKLLKKDKGTRDINNIKSKFTGLFTVYHFSGSYALIVSEYLLNEDGTIKVNSEVNTNA